MLAGADVGNGLLLQRDLLAAGGQHLFDVVVRHAQQAVGVADDEVTGLVLMLVWRVRAPEYFRGETLPMRTSRDLVLAGPYVDSDTYRMPEAGLPEIVISPDLSNLPEGQMAVDPITGERYIRHPKDPSDSGKDA